MFSWNRGANGCNESSTSFESITTGTFLNSRRPERGSSLTRLNVGGDIPCDFLRHENCASVIAGASTEYIHLGRASGSHLVSWLCWKVNTNFLESGERSAARQGPPGISLYIQVHSLRLCVTQMWPVTRHDCLLAKKGADHIATHSQCSLDWLTHRDTPNPNRPVP